MAGEDVVSRADLLMSRRRSFVAAPPAAPSPAASAPPAAVTEPPLPVLTEAVQLEPEADIPVLTEEVMPDAPTAAAPRERFDETIAARLASEFAHALERRLAAELPTLVEASLAVLESDLRRGILDIANDAIKDFVARREQLRLPLDEPENSQK